jgi:hypothetical protein
MGQKSAWHLNLPSRHIRLTSERSSGRLRTSAIEMLSEEQSFEPDQTTDLLLEERWTDLLKVGSTYS